MNKPRAVLFDYGDTILQIAFTDWLKADKYLLDHTVNETALTPEELQEIANRINREFDPKRNESMIEQNVLTFYRFLCDLAGITLSISLEEAAQMSWDSAYTMLPEDGISEVLDTLEKHRILTGIISNSAFPAVIMRKELEKHGLADRFRFVIASADYGIRKPHPRIFEIAAKKLGLEPADIWFAGDKPQYDVVGAAGAGMFPVWYNTDGLTHDHGCNCLEIRSWREFIDIIESL